MAVFPFIYYLLFIILSFIVQNKLLFCIKNIIPLRFFLKYAFVRDSVSVE